MNYNYFKHSSSPIGVTIQADKTIANMTTAEKAEFEAKAVEKEAELLTATPSGQKVWTMDAASAGFPPRGGRPTS